MISRSEGERSTPDVRACFVFYLTVALSCLKMTDPHANRSDAPPQPDDIEDHLHCPKCDYDLSGLHEPRCPECGFEFNLDELRSRYGKEPQPVVPWDLDRSPRTMLTTWIEVAFSPRGLARRFPNVHLRESAASYASRSSLAAIGIGVCAMLAQGGNPFALIAAPLTWGTAFYAGFGACERSLAATYATLALPTNVTSGRDFWLGLLRYSGGFKLVSALAFFSISVGRVLLSDGLFTPGFTLVQSCLMAVPVFWWACTVATMALGFAKGLANRVLLFVCPLLAAMVGAVAGACVRILCTAVFGVLLQLIS